MDKFYIFLINIIIYLLILFAIYIVFQDAITHNVKGFARYMYRKRKNVVFYYYFRKIFITIYDLRNEKEIEVKIYNFYFKTFFLFIAFFVVIFRYNLILYEWYSAVFKALLPSIIISLVPFLLIIVKLFNTQRDSSREASLIVSEISNQYKIYNNNILEAIDRAVINLSDKVLCKRYLITLSMRLKEYQNDEELLRVLDEFIFSISTNWAKMLSDSIFFALTNGIDINLGLDGLLDKIKAIDETQNVGERLNNEGFSMAKYLAPILYVVLIIVSVPMIGSSITDFLYYQFTGNGISYFLLIIALFTACYILEYFYRRRKFDF